MKGASVAEVSGVVQPITDDIRSRIVSLFQLGQVGRCVSSVAHDLNNFLGAILAYAELVGLDPQLGAESQRMVKEIGREVRRCSDLLTVLMEISRKDRESACITSPARLVTRILNLKRYELKTAQIKVETDISEDLPSLILDGPKIELAVMCLLANAIEAVNHRRNRLVRLSVTDTGDSIEIAVWNSGLDVPEPARQAIFEAFFTTKEGDHLGLGLWLAREAAREHSGDLLYDAERGFVMHLPKRTTLSS